MNKIRETRRWFGSSMIVSLILGALVLVMPVERAEAGVRTAHRVGLTGSLFGDPFPSLFGLSLHVNVIDYIRITASYGMTSAGAVSFTTYGGGLKFFLTDGWFAPMIGAQVGIVSDFNFLGFEAAGTAILPSLVAGFDIQSAAGFHFGAGVNYIPISGGLLLPTISLGWFF